KVPDHVILSGGLNNRYMVLDVQERPGHKTLTISCCRSLRATETCLLKDGWELTPVCCGDVVHLEGCSDGGTWLVDREQGFLVLQPDSLISGTSISSSIRCMRRAVLGEMFKVILYSLMSMERYRPDIGLLLYLKTGNIHPVAASRMDHRGTVSSPSHLTRLPDILTNRQTCQYCPQKLSCALYERVVDSTAADLREDVVRAFLQQETGHLTLPHLSYFAHWLLLCSLEASTMEAKNGRKRVWLQSVEESEKNGSCVGNVQLSGSVTAQSEGVFLHRFLRSTSGSQEGVTHCGLTSGDRIVVSDQEGRLIGLATGYLREVNRTSVSCTLDSYTHSAVDNILLKLKRFRVGFLRLGQGQKVHYEASQISQPICMGPLFYAKRSLGMDESLFKRLELHSEAVVQLNVQYRMNRQIMSLSNSLMYDGRLECGSERTATALLTLPFLLSVQSELASYSKTRPQLDLSWLQAALLPCNPVCFLDCSVVSLSFSVYQAGCKPGDIGIIAPYRQQLKSILALLQSSAFTGVEVNTVDRYQGRDKSLILLSFVRSTAEEGNVGVSPLFHFFMI
ncbi:hypothetical protein XENOCAPTIV_005039, partial [Xenoophorus captivus]